VALSAGLEVCSGQRILIMDAHLPDPLELLPDMLRAMDAGADVVYGQRTQRHGESAFKRITASLFYRLLESLVDIKIPVDTGDFRLMSRRSLEVLKAMPEKHRFVRDMVSWIGFNQVPLPYERQERFAGNTKYPLSKMIRFAVDAITSFSVTPLRLASIMGRSRSGFNIWANGEGSRRSIGKLGVTRNPDISDRFPTAPHADPHSGNNTG